MLLWSICVIIYSLFDFYFNYINYYFLQRGTSKLDINAKPTKFMTATYWVVASQFMVLTVLIIWQTILLIDIVKIMGERLKRE